jgi:serine/threonine protein kinase
MMNPHVQNIDQAASADQALGRLVEELTAKLQAGEAIDFQAFVREHPDRAESLGKLLPALQMLAELGHSKPEGIAASAPDVSATDEVTGTLGDFRIFREVGRGGMGVVYEAEQISLGRKVALKVLPFAATLDAKQQQRFKNEAHAAAHLHHQNIVPVYAVGCERGVHYYAMQFIEGQTLAAMIGELRQLSGLDPKEAASPSALTPELGRELLSGRLAPALPASPDVPLTSPYSPVIIHDSPLTTHERGDTAGVAALSTKDSTKTPSYFRTMARLGVQAAEALEHAHGLGVIHRDIKPGNLLVDIRGNLWITDFGLAQVQGDAKLTMSGDLLGTMRYMSPEQALAKRIVVDHRTDIYSLGVTLYELLTLEPAFNGKDRQEVLRQIAFEEPRAPRRINKAIPTELETVVLKALAKNPDERYVTARELADDLERFLKDEPIRAKPPTLAQKAKKWARRHMPVVATAAVAIGVLLILTLAGLLIGNLLLSQANKDIKEQRDLAQENFKKTREAVDKYFTEVSEAELLDRPGMQPLRKKLLQSAQEYYQGFVDQHGEDPTLRKELAEAYRRVGDITILIGSKSDAEVPLSNAIAIFESIHNADPENEAIQSGLARSYQQIAYAQIFGNRPDLGRENAQRAIALFETLRRHSERSEYGRLLGRSYDLLAISHTYDGKYHAGKRFSKKAIEVLEETVQQDSKDNEARRLLALACNNLSSIQYETSEWAEQEKGLQRAITIFQDLVNENPSNPHFRKNLGLSVSALGLLYSYSFGRISRAEPPLQLASQCLRKLADENPSVIEYRYLLGKAIARLGDVRFAQGRTGPAEQYYREAIKLLEEIDREDPHNNQHSVIELAWRYHWLGALLAGKGQTAAGLVQSDRATAIYEKLVHENPKSSHFKEESLLSREQRVRLQVEANRATPAVQVAPQLQIIREREELAKSAPDNQRWQCQVADGYINLGELHAVAGKPEAALSAADQAIRILEKILRHQPQNYSFQWRQARAYALRSGAQKQKGDNSASLGSAQQATGIVEGLVKEEPAYLYDLACHRALCSSLAGESKEKPSPEENATAAVEALRQAVADGYDNIHKLKNDSRLEPLRSRDDFKKLVKELEAKVQK